MHYELLIIFGGVFVENVVLYAQTDNIYSDAEKIIEVTQKQAFRAVDRLLILRNWLLGKRIFE